MLDKHDTKINLPIYRPIPALLEPKEVSSISSSFADFQFLIYNRLFYGNLVWVCHFYAYKILN